MPNYTLILPQNYKKVPLYHKNAWMAALRSGDHKQGRGQLTRVINNEEYNCCLGVKCQVDNLTCDRTPGLPIFYRINGDKSMAYYPGFNKVDIFPGGVSVTKGGQESNTLPSCNDDLKLTFSEIAEIIDELYEESLDPKDV